MRSYEIPQEHWSFKLAPQLVGKAQQAYAAMNVDESGDYESLKAAIMRRYGINEETYRQQFHQARKQLNETNKEFSTRLTDMLEKWMADCGDVEAVKDKIVKEQLIDTLPNAIRIYAKEHKPIRSSSEAGELADDYVQAWRSVVDKEERSQRVCHKCGKPGHLMKDCYHCRKREVSSSPTSQMDNNKKTEKPRKNIKDIECFNCREKGHYSTRCPHSSRTLIRQDLVPEEKMLEGKVITVCCVHGDAAMYPLAKVHLEVDGEGMEVEAAVVEHLPMEVLLGTDVPQLQDLLMKPKGTITDAMVVTRVAAKQDLRRNVKKKSVECCLIQFWILKEALCLDPILRTPDFKKPFILQ